MADIFVSYARSDQPRVAPLVAALEAQGWSVWWDPAITPGQEFDRLIADELARASVVVAVWTAASVQSRWVRGEAREGADRGLLVPVRFGAAPLPIDFRAFHTIDLNETADLGRSAAFRDVTRAIEALAPRRAGAGATAAGPAATPAAAGGAVRAAICVLPFSCATDDASLELIADELTDDVITELSRWRTLAIRSRSTSSRYRGTDVDPLRVARDLDVNYIVEGAVRHAGSRVRVSVKLVDGETGNQLWGDRFDRDADAFAAQQDSLVQTIVSTLVGRVQMSDAERARRKAPASLAAYECVQRGNALPWDDAAAAAEATRLFEQAIALDPGYAIAHALLGTMRIGEWRNATQDSPELLDEAYALTKRAVELDDGDSTCHSLLAHAALYGRSYEIALQHMQRSVDLNPSNAWNRADMGLILTYAGPAEEAVAWLARAREIDPYFDPPWYWRQSGQAYLVLRRFEEALSMFAHIPRRTFRTSAYAAACHARLGDMEKARASADECLAARPGFSVRAFMAKEPFRDQADAEFLAESLRMAGLPA
jgi:adenylate cyclase